MRTQIRSIVADTLGIPLEDVPEDASPETLPEWDSMKHLELMMAIEAAYGIRINTAAMLTLNSIDEIETYIAAQQNATR